MTAFSLRLPTVGVARDSGVLRGYVRTRRGARLVMHVALPPGGSPASVQAYADGRPVPSSVSGGQAVFTLPTRAGQPADWALTS
jgi:hypothetical protein